MKSGGIRRPCICNGCHCSVNWGSNLCKCRGIKWGIVIQFNCDFRENGETRSSGTVEIWDLEFGMWVVWPLKRECCLVLSCILPSNLFVLLKGVSKWGGTQQESTCSPSPDKDNYPLFEDTDLIREFEWITLELHENCLSIVICDNYKTPDISETLAWLREEAVNLARKKKIWSVF